MTRRQKHLGVEWCLPNKKRPFTYSTKATSDLIEVLYNETGSIDETLAMINYDDDAKEILETYLKHGIHNLNLS